MGKILALLALVAVAAAQNNDDPCSPNPDCQTCVSDKDNVCGWCSTDVIYKTGLTGAQCVSNDGSHPFACFGVFSTEDCLPGYVCNKISNTCEQTAPGSGESYAECLQECGPAPPGPSPPAPMYICNTTLNSCVQNQAGTSLNVCQSQCGHVPGAPSQPTPPTNVYKCNQTSLQCHSVPAGTDGAVSKAVCMSQCSEQYTCDFATYTCTQSKNGTVSKEACEQVCTQLYTCDEATATCIVSPYPNPGVPLLECEKNCKPTNNTPSDLAGLWRGLMVQDGFTHGEYDIKFDKGQMQLASSNGAGLSGPVVFVGTTDRRTLQVSVETSTISGVSKGDKLNMTYAFDGATPETRFIMIASGAPNKPAPYTWDAAMKNTGGMTFAMTVCQPQTNCTFNFLSAWRAVQKAAASGRKVKVMSLVDDSLSTLAIEDMCSTFSTCDECLSDSNPNCGWCSVDVMYRDGSPGTHCAGAYPNGTRIQFTCSGIYRSDGCSDYQCVMPQAVCAQVPLGGGMDKSKCEESCVATPSAPSPLPPPPPGPSPPAPMYICNTTTNTCNKDPAGTSLNICQSMCKHAPAVPSQPTPPTPVAATYTCNKTSKQCLRAEPGQGTSLPICLQSCSSAPPPPGPGPAPPVFNGTWRGLEIDNQYQAGEWTLKFSGNDFEFDLGNNKKYSGTIYADGNAGALLLDFDGGVKQAAIYVETNGFTLQKITLVISPNESVPSGWDAPYIFGGSNGMEYVFIRALPSN